MPCIWTNMTVGPDQRLVVLGAVLMLLLVGAAVAGFGPSDGTMDHAAVASDVNRTSTGERYIVDPSRLAQGCPRMDCIPSIDDPSYSSAGAADDWMGPNETIIGVTADGRARAFPLKILTRHEIVNTEIDGEPIAVTYCPLCRSGIVYSRQVDGRTLEFGVSGKLLDANLVMYDRQTETFWSQIRGQAIIGPLTPTELELRHAAVTEWTDWVAAHPGTEVLSRESGSFDPSIYEQDPYAGYDDRPTVGFGVDQVDDRLPEKALVHGARINGSAMAYPDDQLRRDRIVEHSIGGIPVVAFRSPTDESPRLLIRQYDGAVLQFRRGDAGLIDGQGRHWTPAGRLVNGTGQLEQVQLRSFYWFAWAKFNPATEIYTPLDD